MKKTLIFGLIFNLVLFFEVSVLGASFNPFEWGESIRKFYVGVYSIFNLIILIALSYVLISNNGEIEIRW